MLKLIQNEWMKLWNKKTTWVMAILLVVLLVGIFGITKWVETTNDYEMEKWETVVQSELDYTKEQLAIPELDESTREHYEETVKVLEYRLANSVKPLDLEGTSRETMLMQSGSIASVVVLLTVIAAAGIVASEFSQGTIKMLLSRPVKRWKILTSKYIVVILFGILLMFIGFVVSIASAYIFFASSGGQALEWNGQQIVEVSVWGRGLYILLLSSGSVIITTTFAFMIGSVFRSSSLAIGLSLFIYFMGSTVVMFLAKYEIVKYIVFTHMDLTQHTSDFQMVEGITMQFSLTVLAVYFMIFLVISYTVFNRRDITA